MKVRPTVGPGWKPRFAPHIKFRFDDIRQRWVVLAPERLLLPDEIGVEVLKRCDGSRTVTVIAEDLAREYDAPAAEIMADVTRLLQELADKGVLLA